MSFMDIFRRRPIETRSTSGFTAEVITARQSYIAGASGIGELTATVQSCVSLWEAGLSLADVDGADLLDRRSMALLGRSVALRGEALFLIEETGLVPAYDWDVKTRYGRPTAYQLSLPDAGGGTTRTALAAEVLHVRIGSDPATPYAGSAPLRRARLSAGLLHAVEAALGEVFETAPVGSLIVPFPEAPEVEMTKIGAGFRGKRGRVMLRESVAVGAAGGPAPSMDWRPQDMTPDLGRAVPVQVLAEARASILAAFGVLPGLFSPTATGPMVREAQRHLASWVLQPIAQIVAQEASEKLGVTVEIDTLRPLQAFDAGGRARAFGAMVTALAEAKAAGLDPQEVENALSLIDWE